MRMSKFVSILLFLLFASVAYAQQPDTLSYSYDQEYYEEEGEETYEYEPSDEEKIVQDESDEARERVLFIEDLYDYALYLLDADSLVNRYAKYENQDAIIEFVSNPSELEGLERKFEVVDMQSEEPFFFCKEYLFNME